MIFWGIQITLVYSSLGADKDCVTALRLLLVTCGFQPTTAVGTGSIVETLDSGWMSEYLCFNAKGMELSRPTERQ